ncbi:MAG: lipid-A-disaccharide synthase [bacterium]
MKRVLVIAGEASADMHAANLVRAISSLSKEKIEFSGLGGDELISTGKVTPEFYNRDFAVSGFYELIGHIKKIYSTLRYFKKMASMGSYDLAILLDYPDFNMPLAKYLTKIGVPVIYYISPQVWVWRSSRASALVKNSRELLAIFPFEKEFYKKRGLEVTYVGHPLLDQISSYLKTSDIDKIKKDLLIQKNEKIVAVLPGSRHAEIKYILPIMEKACLLIKNKTSLNIRFVLPLAPTIREEDIYSYLTPQGKDLFQIVKNKTYDVYSISDHVLLASGTATVEAGLFNLPMTIVYKVSALSAFLFKSVVRYKNPIGMVNLLLKGNVAKEFFQQEASPEKIAEDVASFLLDHKKQDSAKNKLKELKTILYTGESPSSVVAKHVLKYL